MLFRQVRLFSRYSVEPFSFSTSIGHYSQVQLFNFSGHGFARTLSSVMWHLASIEHSQGVLVGYTVNLSQDIEGSVLNDWEFVVADSTGSNNWWSDVVGRHRQGGLRGNDLQVASQYFIGKQQPTVNVSFSSFAKVLQNNRSHPIISNEYHTLIVCTI